MNAETVPSADVHWLHLGLAEQGKLHALASEHDLALLYYREAMRRAVAAGAPEVFFRHYLECTLESLERAGSFAEVLDYCDRALAHHATLTPEDDTMAAVMASDQAHLHQRRGVALLRCGRADEARDALTQAKRIAATRKGRLPLTEQLLGWLARGFHVEPRRLESELARQGYFAVRPDTVKPDIAIKLSDQQIAALRSPRL